MRFHVQVYALASLDGFPPASQAKPRVSTPAAEGAATARGTFRYPNTCVEDIEYHADRRLDQAQILRLSTGNFVHEKHNAIIMGASGAGKTYIGCALGISACRQFLATKYIRLPELLTDLAVARGDGTYKKVIAQYKKISLLIIDEWLLVSLTATESRDLLDIIEARHQNASTTFQTPSLIFNPKGTLTFSPVSNRISTVITYSDSLLDATPNEELPAKERRISI